MKELIQIVVHYLPKGHLLEGTDDYCVYLKDIEATTKEVMIPRGGYSYNQFSMRENYDLEQVVDSEIPKVELIEENVAFEFMPINSESVNDYYNSFECEIEAIGAQQAFEGQLEDIFKFVKKRLEDRNNEIVSNPKNKRDLVDLTKNFQYIFIGVFNTYVTGYSSSYWDDSEYEFHFDFLGALDTEKIVETCLIKVETEEAMQCKSI